VDSTFKLHLRI